MKINYTQILSSILILDLIFVILYIFVFSDIKEFFSKGYEIGQIFYNLSLSFLAAGIFYYIVDYFPKKTRKIRMLINLEMHLIKINLNVNNILETKASNVYVNTLVDGVRGEIPTIISGSDNVTVDKVGKDYKISVSIPEITREIVKEVQQVGGGVSRNWVEKYVDSAVADISGGSGFTPIAGDGITIVPIGANYEFSVNDYISSTEVASISGDLQSQIDGIVIPDLTTYTLLSTTATISAGLDSRLDTLESNPIPDIFRSEVATISGGLQGQINAIVQEGTTITSSGGSIIVTNTGLEYNLEVASAPIQNHNDLNGLQGIGGDGGYYHLTEAQYANISGGVDLSDYTLLSTTASISGDLDSRIDTLETNPIPDIFRSEVASISGDLQSQIDGIVIPDLTPYTLLTTTASISGGLDGRITVLESNPIPDIFRSEVASISGDLQSQIDVIIQEGTSIASSGGSIIVTQDGLSFNLEVASAPIQNHNDLNGLQGGITNEYYHLTASEYGDLIGATEVASISGGLDSRITAIENDYVVSSDLSNYTLLTTTSSISGDLQSQIDAIVIPDVSNFITTTEVASISGDLQGQINLKQNNITLVAGSNISIVESPIDTWTISADISGGGSSSGIQGRNQLNNSDTTYTITHPSIDTATDFPVASLEINSSTADLFIVGIHNRTSTSFQVTLSGVPDTNTYILWHICTATSSTPISFQHHTFV
jgi:hypothetical protein